jgi:CheY-like chemotaxis protein/nitrogen-specific signal transduction histidine kinase
MADPPPESEPISRELTDLERKNRSLEDALAAERDANRRKDEFLAILSHDLRTPLNAALTWIEVLRNPRVEQQTRDRALASLERMAKLQARMIDDLLDISRIATGKLSLELQAFDLAGVIRGAVETMLSAVQDKGIEVEVSLDPKCVPIRGDPARLHQIVANLVSNSVKFTPSGGRIRVELRCPDNIAEIEVNDTGVGIKPDLLPFVFDRFRQGMVATRSGLGLGLAIARHVAELHGGSIQAESEGPGCGARFTVRLPLERGVEVAPYREPPDASLEPALSLKGVRVLLVDDNQDTRFALEEVLRQAGALVHTANSVPEALRKFDEEPPDVLVTDLLMPEQDGYALLKSVRGRMTPIGGTVPAIALSGAASPEDRQRVADAGFALHITKPVDPAELIRAVAMTAAGRAKEFAGLRLQALMKSG